MIRVPFARTYFRLLSELKFKQELAKEGLFLNGYRLSMMIDEWRDWSLNYLPTSIKNLVVLDVGAGRGETAFFFLKHGAKHVIAIEADPQAFQALKRNATNKPITPIQEYFDLKHLDLPFDFAKIDIEGWEECLLKEGVMQRLNKPMVVEVHGIPLCNRFADAGFKVRASRLLTGQEELMTGCTRYAYINC